MEIKVEGLYINIIEQANVRKRVQIECAVWHLDVGLAHPHERRNHEGFDCSSIKELHELGLIRRETVWFLSSRGYLSKIKLAPLYERNCGILTYGLLVVYTYNAARESSRGCVMLFVLHFAICRYAV